MEEVCKDYKKGKGENYKPLREIKTGEVFGSLGFFGDIPPETSIVCRTFCSIYEIKKEEFMAIIKEKKEDFVKIILSLKIKNFFRRPFAP